MRRMISVALLFSIIIAGALLGGCRGFPLRPQAEETPTATLAAMTISFEVNKDHIAPGESATLSWDVQNATTVLLDGQGVDHQGSREEQPDSTHTYTLSAENPCGTLEQEITVFVETASPTPVPPTSTPVPATPTPTVGPSPTPAPPPCDIAYVVQPWDTLYSIARRYNIPVQAIMTCNPLLNPNYIMIGQIILLPSSVQGITPPPWCAEAHVVQLGDTLFSIAQKYGVPMQVILAYNILLDPNWIWVGQIICIPSL